MEEALEDFDRSIELAPSVDFICYLLSAHLIQWMLHQLGLLKFRVSQPEQQQFLDFYGLVPDMQICGRSSVE
jgi:hypothetical protein